MQTHDLPIKEEMEDTLQNTLYKAFNFRNSQTLTRKDELLKTVKQSVDILSNETLAGITLEDSPSVKPNLKQTRTCNEAVVIKK